VQKKSRLKRRFCICSRYRKRSGSRTRGSLRRRPDKSTKKSTERTKPVKRTLRVKQTKSSKRATAQRVLQAEVITFYTIADGAKRIFTDHDQIQGVGRNCIPDPRKVSFESVYVNGVLQPTANYTYSKGKLMFLTTDLPPKNAPILAQFICLNRVKPSSARRRSLHVATRRKEVMNLPASLVKLFITATASQPVASNGEVTTTVNPTVSRFVATVDADMIGATETVIQADSFVDDNGDPVTELPVPTTSGYFNVYSNGVLQEGGLSALTATELTLATTEIQPGTPVILEIVDFSNTTSQITVEPIISAPDITVNT